MIVKKIRSKVMGKPKHWQISDLVDYIRFPHNKDPQEKIEYAGGRNFYSATHGGQKLEMVSLAQQSVHSKMPVSHWVFSWQEQEQPSRQNVEELVDVFLKEMGLEGHQVIYGLHNNTHCYHVHIAVNRMNENTGKVVLPHNGFDIEAAHKVVAIVEHRQKWGTAPNPRYEVLENGDVARKRRTKNPTENGQKADNMVETESAPSADISVQFEQRTGQKSAQTIGKEKALPIIQKAKSWAELHLGLANLGIRFEKKGSGAIIHVGETVVKASTIDRSISLSKLCKKLGDFVPGQYGEMPEVLPEPVDDIVGQGLAAEWEEYIAEKDRKDTPRVQEEQEQQRSKKPGGHAIAMARLRKKQREKRRQKMANLKKHGLQVLNIASHCLKLEQQEERRLLRQTQREKAKSQRMPSFEKWLMRRDKLRQASLWRRRSKKSLANETVEQESLPPVMHVIKANELDNFNAYAAAVDADRYRVTSIRMYPNGDKQVFILDKKNGVTKGFTTEEMACHMPHF